MGRRESGRACSGQMRGIAVRACCAMWVRVYVTMDSWKSREAYEKFREKFAAEYEELHRKCEGMTVRERNLGAHES
jgi:hypothetical protein